MTLQERLREYAKNYEDTGYLPSARRMREAADAIDAHERALAEIREVWAGSECGEPVYAQEAYAIRLCKQMYQIACDALSGKAPVAPDEVNRLSVRCESQRLKIDAQEARIKELEGALLGMIEGYDDIVGKFGTAIVRAREALK